MDLYAYLLRQFCKPGDTILDTHLGSGSSRIAAYKMGFDFTGCEIDPEYYNLQERRFRKECLGQPDRHVEVADIWGFIRGEKRRAYLRLWSEGETNVEIAERTGASYGTVSSEICRAIKELKMFYQKDIAV